MAAMAPVPMAAMAPAPIAPAYAATNPAPQFPANNHGQAIATPPPSCPRCHANVAAGVVFCQNCGFQLTSNALGNQPTAFAAGPMSGSGYAGIDPHAPTSAAVGPDAIRAGSIAPPVQPFTAGVASAPVPQVFAPGALNAGSGPNASLPTPHAPVGPGPAPGNPLMPSPFGASLGSAAAPVQRVTPAPSWGVAVLVNRDGSDGERFALSSDHIVIGREHADLTFPQDRFIGRIHARFERTAEQVRMLPIDTVNGVFRRIDGQTELSHGSIFLVGREVVRFERVDADERTASPLVQHGVAMFGSPPRDPWGRLAQLLPTGGVRDVRYLSAPEFHFGREEGDWIFRDDAFMSRRHANLSWDGTRAWLADLNSSNGTFLRIAGPTPLRHGDQLRMGDQLLRIELTR